MELVLLVAFVLLLSSTVAVSYRTREDHRRLSGELTRLTERIRQLEARGPDDVPRRPAPPIALPQAEPPRAPRPPAPPNPAVAVHSPSRMGLEERLGARLFVYIGGIALALASVFMVKIAIDSGWVSPSLRVTGGALAGVVMLVLGERMRGRSDNIPQALCGAGIASLFASVLAAVKLYGLIGPGIGLALVGGITALAVALSVRHGKFVAILGIVCGFLLPLVIRPGGSIGPAFFGYLLVLEIGAVAVARRRNWLGLSTVTAIAGAFWALLTVVGLVPTGQPALLSAFAILTAAAFVVASAGDPGERSTRSWSWASQGVLSLGGAFLVVAAVAARGPFRSFDLLVLAALGISTIVLGGLDARYRFVPWLGAALGGAVLAGFGASGGTPAAVTLFIGLYGAIFGIGGYLVAWRSAHAQDWGLLAGLGTLGYFLLWRFQVASRLLEEPWISAAGMTLLAAAATAPFLRRRTVGALPVLALITNVFATLAVLDGVAAWETRWWSLGLGALVAVVAWAWLRWDLPILRFAIAWNAVGVVLTAIVPGLFFGEYGSRVLLNRILLQFGGPALCLFAASAPLVRAGQAERASALRKVASAMAIATVALLIRHGFHREGLLWSGGIGMLEWATYAVAGLLGGAVLKGRAGVGIGLAGMAISVVGSGFVENPLWTPASVGAWPVLNWLLLLFGVPSLLASLAASRREDGGRYATIAKVYAIVSAFTWISLNVRHGFVGAILDLDTVGISNPERYAYSLAWILFSVVLLAVGMATRGASLRYGSLVVMVLAIGKVFAYDTLGLSGMLRVASYAGLGVSLMAVGYAYQRFVFRVLDSRGR